MRAALAVAALLAVGCDEGREIPPGSPGVLTPRDASVGDAAPSIGDAATGPHAARCAAACDSPPGPCSGENTSACASDCAARLEGLSPLCAACVTDRSEWTGRACTCIGSPCTACGFGVGPQGCSSPAPNEVCAASDERCTGFEHGRTATGDCAAVCVGGDAGVPTTIDYADRCAAACRRPSSGPCASADEATCRAACRAHLSGLPPRCGLCLLEASGYAGDRCSCGSPEACTLCPFGPGGRACQGAMPGETCDPATESCDGFELATTTGGRCDDECQ